MKKVLFTIGIIAILFGVAFAGMAVASKPPNPCDTMIQMINALDQKVTALQSEVAAIKDELLSTGIQKFETDQEKMQLASATFFADGHSGWKDINANDNPSDPNTFNDNVWGRTNSDGVAGNYFPTAIAKAGNTFLALSTTEFDSMHPGNALLIGSGGLAATDAEIQVHAIWMGLLLNPDGTGTTYDGTQDRAWVSPLAGQWSLYVDKMPDSAMAGNSYNGCLACCGHSCWVVGKTGLVLGAYRSADGNWYSGYNCSYP